MTRDQVEFIHTSSLGILEEIGVAVHEESAFSAREDSGARVDHKTNVVLIPESLVLEALAKAPKSFRLYSRDHKNDLVLQGNNVY